MRRPATGFGLLAFFLLLLLSGLPVLAAGAAPVLKPQVLRRLPHDPAAFTEGLVLHQGAFFESTGLYGQSSLRRVDPQTGRVLARVELAADLFGEGLALCPAEKEPRLIQLTWREGVILTYDPRTLRPLSRVPLRGQGWGLACGEHALVMSDGSDTLRWLDPATLAETGGTLAVREGKTPVRELNELEWVNGWLLANIWQKDRVAVIHPRTGQVAAWLDLSPLRRELAAGAEVANGLAFDPFDRTADRTADTAADRAVGGVLYVTGKRWNLLFALRLPELLKTPPR